jgi:hypothetical protein
MAQAFTPYFAGRRKDGGNLAPGRPRMSRLHLVMIVNAPVTASSIGGQKNTNTFQIHAPQLPRVATANANLLRTERLFRWL